MFKDSNALANFHDVLVRHGLQAGVEFLNQRVPHRYTSIYRLQREELMRIAYIDKRGAPCEALARAALKDSFCEIAFHERALVAANDLKADPRFNTRPNPAHLGSYVGLPLTSRQGALFGTLCHADDRCCDLSDAEFAFLGDASTVLEAYLAQIFPPGETGGMPGQAQKSRMSGPDAGAPFATGAARWRL